MAHIIQREGSDGLYLSDPARGIHRRIEQPGYLPIAKSLYGETVTLPAYEFDTTRQLARDVAADPVKD